jgi:phosphatidylglycerol:prolipoprotein diacylglycerol transferase
MITIGSYGLLLGIAFYLAFLLTEREFRLKDIDPDLAYKLLIVIIPSAIIGAKVFHIFENFEEFVSSPASMIFSGAGLSVYGGFVLSFISAIVVIRKNNEKVLKIFDTTSPSMALGYAIGRLGCHASGDGCYGIPSDSIFSVAYPNGIVPITANVVPAPLLESFASFLFFLILMKLRKHDIKTGMIFFIYLIMNGFARFMVEFVRLNPVTSLCLTKAQIVAAGFIIIGIAGLIILTRRDSGFKPDAA